MQIKFFIAPKDLGAFLEDGEYVEASNASTEHKNVEINCKITEVNFSYDETEKILKVKHV